MTAFNSKLGGFSKRRLPCPDADAGHPGRARGEDQKFVSRDFWEVVATFDAAAGQYAGRWFDEKFARADGKDGDDQLKPERVWEKDKARPSATNAWANRALSRGSKPSTSLSPLLYDLTSLQRDANSRFGFSAKNTLGLAQSLYERHKVLTYPRTDSRALPEDYIAPSRGAEDARRNPLRDVCRNDLKSGWVHPNKRIFNNAKVSDHFAIIPTTLMPTGLSEPEHKLYDMVTKRFLAIFYPAAEFLETIRITRVEGEPFKSTGRSSSNPAG